MENLLIRVAAAAVVAGLAAGLAGCAPLSGLTVTHTILIDPLYAPTDLRSAPGPIPVRIIGAAPDGASVDETLDALALPGRLGGRAAVAEGPLDEGRLRIVFAYAPLSATRICEAAPDGAPSGEPNGAAPSGGRTGEISAALCRGARQLTYGIMTTPAAGPRDPGFRAAVLNLYSAILPAQRLMRHNRL